MHSILPFQDVVLDGMKLSECRDSWDEDWFLGINGVSISPVYPKPDLNMIKRAASMKKINTVLDICCGFKPVSNLLYDPSVSDYKPRLRALIDHKTHVHKLAEKCDDRPLTLKFDLRQIENPLDPDYSLFSEEILKRKWNLIMAVNAFNYVDWRKVSSVLSQTQASGDLFFITNHPLLGYSRYFFPGPTPMPEEIRSHLEHIGYEIVARRGQDLAHFLAQKK